MTPKTKALVLRGLAAMRGDDLERAAMAFRGLSHEEMQKEYGESGRTRQEILDGYRQRVDDVAIAVKEIEAL